ncbi:DUF2790 domain-containing protein [Pseudomonas sp. WS 5106]|uniref:DUF2790 domain-containing protein n=1 Tax=Pseudomonas cremoris TaxID=2724178 RepID=A0A7X1AJA0_9PSED|nr:DUF2790 domain-containing protein [Pseudomonas cremoris]MBC2380184.1 DUF2790 domain-containing protein [Pseudomonas cremoris]MBC2405465.1 DUF2790 domain-containing protein [Pseudomonas cremoris]
MNPNNWNIFIASSLLALTFNAQASAKPDIQSVLSTVEDSSTACGVVNAHMTYLDSHGQKQVLDYSKFASNCADGS